ncbi:bifunctional [glutamine synthetase] adenylyltransferase/[glutamine synthetase]-adenylyl-L-tyrosine phosphorylase [Glaciihabitans sp. dw_435]|uniref:bifunctional [glutamine synthetase] adenylyltransferase/[glutamine synthetase]-adenylyl-L-tyrosine phosphorylase n=1 Tax=Glaciihabitans sp. dw_435 TaxID=2720081 RepID=UPI001BD54406|nr:bifunctional [glutamine synthetase] adenylyltransferase/[glutamine synthetase]-adenylyl-L-tyrosine phosphorylase [Glaciihabitans sp. dw_435]
MYRNQTTLTELARLGFTELGSTRELLDDIPAELVAHFANAADPDQALRLLTRLRESAPSEVGAVLRNEATSARLIRLLGASEGLGDFFHRHPEELAALGTPLWPLPSPDDFRADLVESVQGLRDDEAFVALRVRYRRHLARIAAWDLENTDPLMAVSSVTAMLSDLAGAALDASLDVARRCVRFPADDVARTRLSIIGMGKAGARELNYVSDVDVIFVGEAADGLSTDRAMEIATRLAMQTARGIQELTVEPALWEVDANLRPEGKDGALVRTLESHLAYYDRWARGWEFQALLKARPLAGDLELGERYVAGVSPLVWTSASRAGFVESVQKMRERVTENIPPEDRDIQVKLGPGGLRDIEFTIQLLQLVHGQHDDQVRQAATLPALVALAAQGYIGRVEAAEFSRDYRFLRLIEHRLQLTRLIRTHMMPRDPEAVRVLARSTGLYANGSDFTASWQRTKQAVRSLHERLFYRPLLSAVASLPGDELTLSSDQAAARLAAIGFRDPRGALHHIAALTGGVSRRATIQRTLLPVMLQWFSEGADPDHGLLAFRLLSDHLGEAYWFLRMLRDSSGAAQRLTHVLASSKFVGDLLERIPEGAAWLENEEELRPRPLAELLDETRATIARHRDDVDAAALALRTARRREVLRLAIAGILGFITIEELGVGLSDINTAILTGVVSLARPTPDGIEFGIIAMGRYGGEELGFGSDADIMYVYRALDVPGAEAQATSERIIHTIVRLTEDLRLPLDLDIGLRPEGRNGATVRSLDSYRAYYARWSLTWEAQALLRARGAVGDDALLRDFEALADEVRYPDHISEQNVREVKRIKARVESERLPQGADPSRHLKLGRGSLSDVEWFVQLLQLQHAATVPGLRTPSTLRALSAATDAGLIDGPDAARLHDAWIIASRARSAMTLWTSKTADVLPTDRQQLEGVARLLEYPPGSATALEEDYLRITRHARQVFERRFYGVAKGPTPTG